MIVTDTHTHARMHTHAHAHTHMRTHAHTHTHTCTHTQTLGVCLSLLRNHEAVAQEIKQFLQLLSTADTNSHESDQTEDSSTPSEVPNSDKKND